MWKATSAAASSTLDVTMNRDVTGQIVSALDHGKVPSNRYCVSYLFLDFYLVRIMVYYYVFLLSIHMCVFSISTSSSSCLPVLIFLISTYELRHVWVAEQKKQLEEEAAKAELKKKARKSKDPETQDAQDVSDIVEVGKFDFLGSALGGVLHSSDASLPHVVEKPSKGTKRSAGSSSTPGDKPSKVRRTSFPSASPSPSPSPSTPGGSGNSKGKKGQETGLRPSEIRAKRVREEQKLSTAMQKCQHILEIALENTTELARMNAKSMTADLKKLRDALSSSFLDLCKDEGADHLQSGLEKHSQAPHVSVTFHYT